MINLNLKKLEIEFSLRKSFINNLSVFLKTYFIYVMSIFLSIISISFFIYYLNNGYGLAYNDARSHLDIGRRVVESLKPGMAQLGSVWLPLPHFLMLLTVWNDFMWHSGLAGALQSMISYVLTSCLIFLFLRKIGVGWFGRIIGVIVFAFNLNVLYMQSTAMTELLLLATMTAGVYELLKWNIDENLFSLIKSAFWIMLSTLIRYDGWFLFIFAALIIFGRLIFKSGYKKAEGSLILFGVLGGLGIFLWLIWNLMIFKDIFYFITGPYSASAQQALLAADGALPTKHNFYLSLITYLYGVIYNSSFFFLIIAFFGLILFFTDKRLSLGIKLGGSALLAPLFFNILALYFGHSVLYVQNLNSSWFNVRYGLMMIPSIAIFVGFFVDRFKSLRFLFLGLFILVSTFSFLNRDIVTLDDALIGASGKNVKEVSGWLEKNVSFKTGYVLISVASHDAIIFSSNMKMSRFIHEGTGEYWEMSIKHPTKYARWIIMRTSDEYDNTFRLLKNNNELENYNLVNKYPFADIYEIKPEFLSNQVKKF